MNIKLHFTNHKLIKYFDSNLRQIIDPSLRTDKKWRRKLFVYTFSSRKSFSVFYQDYDDYTAKRVIEYGINLFIRHVMTLKHSILN